MKTYNFGSFQSAINEISNIFDFIGMEFQQNKIVKKPKNYLTEIRNKSYQETYDYIFSQNYYNFYLNDVDAILAFHFDNVKNGLNYNFMESELSKEQNYLDTEDTRNFLDDDIIRNHPVYFRYDFDLKEVSKVHPPSHIHFGFNTSIRMGIYYQLSPLKFTLFLLRQVYPKYWSAFLTNYDDDPSKLKITNPFSKLRDIEYLFEWNKDRYNPEFEYILR